MSKASEMGQRSEKDGMATTVTISHHFSNVKHNEHNGTKIEERMSFVDFAISQTVHDLRARKGMGQEDLATMANVSRRTIVKIESGNHDFKYSTMTSVLRCPGMELQCIPIVHRPNKRPPQSELGRIARVRIEANRSGAFKYEGLQKI